MSFLPGIGGLAGLGGILAAPFTGGSTLALTAGGVAQNAAYVASKKKSTPQPTAVNPTTTNKTFTIPDFLRISTTNGKIFYASISALGIVTIIYLVRKR
jgi:hypothetical protein